MTSSASCPVSFMTSATERPPSAGSRVDGTRRGGRPPSPRGWRRRRRAAGSRRGAGRATAGSARRSISGAGTAGLDPLRQLDEQTRAGPLGRIGIEGDVETLGAGVVDQREQRLGTARMRLAVVEVGDVRRRAGPPADLDRLADRVEVAVAERVADVGVVEAAVPPGLLE